MDFRSIYTTVGILSRIGKGSPQIESGNHRNHDRISQEMMVQVDRHIVRIRFLLNLLCDIPESFFSGAFISPRGEWQHTHFRILEQLQSFAVVQESDDVVTRHDLQGDLNYLFEVTRKFNTPMPFGHHSTEGNATGSVTTYSHRYRNSLLNPTICPSPSIPINGVHEITHP
jgi:hypothetical protein